MRRILTTALLCACLSLLSAEKAGRLLPPFDFNGQRLDHIEIADTPKSRARGLMERTALPRNAGMCFIQDQVGPAVFWMKHTRIPLDAIFIDAYGMVLKITTMAVEAPQAPGESTKEYESRLPQYGCRGAVACIVELAAGAAEELGIQEGTVIRQFSLTALRDAIRR